MLWDSLWLICLHRWMPCSIPQPRALSNPPREIVLLYHEYFPVVKEVLFLPSTVYGRAEYPSASRLKPSWPTPPAPSPAAPGPRHQCLGCGGATWRAGEGVVRRASCPGPVFVGMEGGHL